MTSASEPRLQRAVSRIKLRHLNVLMAVAQSGSMAKAAERLAITQPVISKAIADLENTVGVRLLDRNPQGVQLTMYGEALLKRSAALFNDLRASLNELESLADPSAGELRIGTTEPMTAGLLSAIIDRLTTRYPRLRFHVILGDPVVMQRRELPERDIDLFIGRLPSEDSRDDIATEVLAEEQAFVVAAVQHPLTRRRKIGMDEMVDERWAFPPSDSFAGELIAHIFRASGLEVPATSVRAHSIQLQAALVATGRFLAILPGTLLQFSGERMGLAVLRVDMPVQPWLVGIATLKNRTLNPAAQLFVECAREVARVRTR